MNEPAYFAAIIDQAPPTFGEDVIIGAYPVLGVQPMPSAANRRKVRADWPAGSIGDRVIIGHHAVIGAGVLIGADCRLGDHVNIREGCIIGDRCVVGTKVDIQFECVIGDDVKILNGTQITGKSVIGNGVFIGPGVQSMNDAELFRAAAEDYRDRGQAGITIGDFVRIGGAAVLLPGIRIGDRAMIAAGAVVTRDVAPAETVFGFPARARSRPHQGIADDTDHFLPRG